MHEVVHEGCMRGDERVYEGCMKDIGGVYEGVYGEGMRWGSWEGV